MPTSELSLEIARLRYKYVWPFSAGEWHYSDTRNFCGTRIPEPDTDRADCFELLEYVLSQSHSDEQQITLTDIHQGQEWYVELHSEYPSGNTRLHETGESVRLTLAIATACRDALLALRETETP